MHLVSVKGVEGLRFWHGRPGPHRHLSEWRTPPTPAVDLRGRASGQLGSHIIILGKKGRDYYSSEQESARMPESGLCTGTGVPESHTSTCQWQGFEFRMRRRRADRCLLRASAALDADVPEIAQQLIEEARALDPHHPELQDVTGRLLAASELAAAAAAIGNGRSLHQLISRGLVVLLAVALALMWPPVALKSADVKEVLDLLLIIVGSAGTYISPAA